MLRQSDSLEWLVYAFAISMKVRAFRHVMWL